MIDGFKEGFWYKFNGKAKSVYINDSGEEFVKIHEEFMLDKNWHQCKKEGINCYAGCFYDSSDPNRCCVFGDGGKPRGKNLYMFDEMRPGVMNIKKLKELREN